MLMLLRTIMLLNPFVHFGILALMLFLTDQQLIKEHKSLDRNEFQNHFEMHKNFQEQDEIQNLDHISQIQDILEYINQIRNECLLSQRKKVIHKRDQSEQMAKTTLKKAKLLQQLHQFLETHGHLPQTIFLKNQKDLAPSVHFVDIQNPAHFSENTIENIEYVNNENKYQQEIMVDNEINPNRMQQRIQQYHYDPPIRLEVTEITQEQLKTVDSPQNLPVEDWQQKKMPSTEIQNENQQFSRSKVLKENVMGALAQLRDNQGESELMNEEMDENGSGKKEKSNRKMMWTIVGQISAAIACIQAYLLLEAWEQINLANNVVLESERQIAEISSNIGLLFSATDHLLFLRNRWENRYLHYKERKRIMGQIRKKMYRMGFLQYQTGKLLTDKRIELTSGQNGKLLHQRQQITNGLINIILFVLNALQIFLSGEMLTDAGSLFQFAIIATYLALPIGNAALYILVGEQINSLRETENEIHQLEVTLGSIFIHFQDTEDWLEFTIEDPAVKYHPKVAIDSVNTNVPISGTFNAGGFSFAPFSFPQAMATAATTAAATTAAATTPAATTPAATTPAVTTPATTIRPAIVVRSQPLMILNHPANVTKNSLIWLKNGNTESMAPSLTNETISVEDSISIPVIKKVSTFNDYYDSSESDEWNPFESEEE